MKSFEIKHHETTYTIIPEVDEKDPHRSVFKVIRDGITTCTLWQKDDDTVAWEACEGALSEGELAVISDGIESRYL